MVNNREQLDRAVTHCGDNDSTGLLRRFFLQYETRAKVRRGKDDLEDTLLSIERLVLAVNIPYGRLELDVRRIAPRKTTRVVLYGDGNELAIRAGDRLARIEYANIAILDGGGEA